MHDEPIDFAGLYKSIENDNNKDLSLSLLRTLCEYGHPEALFAIAQWSLDGKYGCRLTTSEAIELLQLSSESGHHQAPRNLAIYYEFGRHVAKDMKKAFELYLIAAFRGNSDALEDVGRFIAEKYVPITPELIGKIAFSEFDRVKSEELQ